MNKFQKWLVTFSEEKGLDMGDFVVAGDGTYLCVGDVLSNIMSAPEHEQKQIQKIMVSIDFNNGDIMHFIKHCAKALNKSHKLEFDRS